MIAPLPPYYSMKITEDNKKSSSEFDLYNDQLWQSLNAVVNQFNNGIVAPSYTTAEIVALEVDASIGTIWFNSTISKLQVKTAAGTIETITST